MSNAKNPPKNQPAKVEGLGVISGTVAQTEGPPGEGEQIGYGADAITEPVIRAPSMDDVSAMRAKIASLEQERDAYRASLAKLDGPPIRGPKIELPDEFFGPMAAQSLRPSIDVLLRDLPPGYTSRELEQLAAGILKLAGHAGKTPTGKHVARHAFMRDKIDETTGKTVRVAPGTVLDDLSPAEVAHLTKHKAIEPEYA